MSKLIQVQLHLLKEPSGDMIIWIISLTIGGSLQHRKGCMIWLTFNTKTTRRENLPKQNYQNIKSHYIYIVKQDHFWNYNVSKQKQNNDNLDQASIECLPGDFQSGLREMKTYCWPSGTFNDLLYKNMAWFATWSSVVLGLWDLIL